VINKLTTMDLGGFRFVVDLLANQAEPIINLFEQLCTTTTTAITSANKNDPRLANAAAVTSKPAAPMMGPMEPVSHNKEDRESISNSVASLPPAQVCSMRESIH
jgi:hypothetical protein